MFTASSRLLIIRRGGLSHHHRRSLIVHHPRCCWNSTTTTTTVKSNNNEKNSSSSSSTEELFYYEAPMGGLVSRLKIVSITSCALSLIGLPMFVFVKNGFDLPNTQQLGMGGIALFGATGSTLALHFVFGPYALTMEEIPVRKCNTNQVEEEEEEGDGNTTTTTTASTSPATLLKATTRSVFGWKNEIIFDPATDVVPYSGGARPFANFIAKDVTIYAHPELLSESMKQKLLFPPTTTASGDNSSTASVSVEKNEGIPSSKKMKDDDDFF